MNANRAPLLLLTRGVWSVPDRGRTIQRLFDPSEAHDTVEDEEEYVPEAEEDVEDDDALPEAETEESEDTEASLDEILAAKPEERAAAEEEDDDDSMLALGRDDRVEPLAVKVVPPDPNKEFTCRKCYLVKHRSQLADKKRMYCRDCA